MVQAEFEARPNRPFRQSRDCQQDEWKAESRDPIDVLYEWAKPVRTS